MISNQILQSTIETIKGITRMDLAVVDTDGKILSTTFTEAKEVAEMARQFAASPADSQTASGHQFFKIFDETQLEYILIARGESDENYMVGKMAAFQITSLVTAYKEKFDKDNFIKNLLLDNLLLVDVFNRSKKLHIRDNVPRAVYMVQVGKQAGAAALEGLKTLFSGHSRDFVTAVDEENVLIVREVSEDDDRESLMETANTVLGMLETEMMISARIGIGTTVYELKDVSKSYKEAKMALDVGNIFMVDEKVIHYGSLGIGRLIYQLPLPLCHMFIDEIFKELKPDEFDEETLSTIQMFFDNNLNVSETSRQLYIHRNTLVYRLDKLMRATGLDLRNFDDAITFKISLMVQKYMDYLDHTEF